MTGERPEIPGFDRIRADTGSFRRADLWAQEPTVVSQHTRGRSRMTRVRAAVRRLLGREADPVRTHDRIAGLNWSRWGREYRSSDVDDLVSTLDAAAANEPGMIPEHLRTFGLPRTADTVERMLRERGVIR